MNQKSTRLLNCIKLLSKVPLPILYFFAYGLAWIVTHLFQSKLFKNVKLNIAIAFPHLPETELKQLCKRAITHEILSYFEFIHIWSNSNQKNIQLIHQIHGEQYLHQALAQQKGIVLIVPHFGTWEVMNAWLSQYTTMTIMYKPVKNEAIDAFVLEARSREHAHMIRTDESGVKKIFRVLKQGGTTAILPDHSPVIESDYCSWFNIPVYTSQLTAKLIQKTGAAGFLLYALRNPQGGFDLNIQPISSEIYTPQIDATRLISATLEHLIQQYPQHYHWSYKRFNANEHTRSIYDMPYHDALRVVRQVQQKI